MLTKKANPYCRVGQLNPIKWSQIVLYNQMTSPPFYKLLNLRIKKAHPFWGWAFSCQNFNQAKFAMKNPATFTTLTEFRWSGSAVLDLFRRQELTGNTGSNIFGDVTNALIRHTILKSNIYFRNKIIRKRLDFLLKIFSYHCVVIVPFLFDTILVISVISLIWLSD